MSIKYCQNGWFKYYVDESQCHHILIELDNNITHIKSKDNLSNIFNSVDCNKTIQENDAYIKAIALQNNTCEEKVEAPKKVQLELNLGENDTPDIVRSNFRLLRKSIVTYFESED